MGEGVDFFGGDCVEFFADGEVIGGTFAEDEI